MNISEAKNVKRLWKTIFSAVLMAIFMVVYAWILNNRIEILSNYYLCSYFFDFAGYLLSAVASIC